MALGGLDAQGVYKYGSDDLASPTPDLLNLAPTSISNELAKIRGVPAAYVPTMTGVTLGTGGTLVGLFQVVGKAVDFKLTATLGTGGVLTANPAFGLPVPRPATPREAIGLAFLTDASGPAYRLFTVWSAAATAVSIADQSAAGLSPTVPWTWAVGDILTITGRYFAA
jgi:hypothetical protein